MLSVGRNHKVKAYEIGIEAFAEAIKRATIKNLYYVIVGGDSSRLYKVAKKNAVQDKVKLIEQLPISKMPEVFNSADIFMSTSLIEGFSQVNAQALASGLPCIISDSPGNIDSAEYGGVLLARTNDINSISDKISMLALSSDLRNSLSQESKEKSKKLTWSHIARQYLEVFLT